MIPNCKKDYANRSYMFGEDQTTDWSTLNIPITLHAGDIYDFVISGTLVGDNAGDILNLCLQPVIGVPSTNRVSLYGLFENNTQHIQNMSSRSGLYLARGTVGNGFLFTGTITYTGTIMQSISNGGITNDSVNVNAQFMSIMAMYNREDIEGFILKAGNKTSPRTRFLLTRRYPL